MLWLSENKHKSMESSSELKFENRNELSPKNRIMVFTGISGSGKDLILRQCMEQHEFPKEVSVVSFGEKISERLKIDRDRLKHDLKSEEITEVVDGVIEEQIQEQPLVLNTHVVYEQNNTLQINVESLLKLNPSIMVFVLADPENIQNWRHSDSERNREQIDVKKIALQQKIALNVTKTLAEELGVDFILVRNIEGCVKDDLELLSRAINNL